MIDRPTRNEARADFPLVVRMELLEQDADTSENRHAEMKHEIKKTNQRLMGLILTLATTSILLAGNLVSGSIGG